MADSLLNKRVAIPETRELNLLARMLEQEGARVLRCPLVSILDVPDPLPVEAWLRRAIAGRFHDVIFYTGEGVRRLLGFAERAGLRDSFIAALAQARKITRGPKPVRALRDAGLQSDLAALTPTTDGIIASLSAEDMQGRIVGVQLYGQKPNEQLIAFLLEKGAIPDAVAPYVYAPKSDEGRVAALLTDLAAGAVDVIAFTSSPQVARLLAVARDRDLIREMREGLARTGVVAVGPVVARELARAEIRVDVTAPSPFSLKPLVRTIAGMNAPRGAS